MSIEFSLNPELMAKVRWSKGSCGQSGCTDPECVCALCAQAIGVSEDVLEQSDHDPQCCGCPLCCDQVPIMLFRGEGEKSEQAAFHTKCFERMLTE